MLFLLLLPAALLFWKTPAPEEVGGRPRFSARFAWAALAYFALYLAATFKAHFIASAAGLWLFQFVIPLLLMRVLREDKGASCFRWSGAFKDLKPVLWACLLLLPLVFVVRDSSQVLGLFRSGGILLFLPLSAAAMLLLAAFWEEYFFRGILQASIRRLTGSAAAAVGLSALFFALYHFPMRYLNPNSSCYLDAGKALAENLNEHLAMGLLLGFAVHRTRNVWTGVWLHSFINGLSSAGQVSSWIKF
ncbi:MAG TPA: CPBP family intramembrane metalloprotease [Elusimicrobiales bacterium]|nr:CPBP family intramembrane metalloprotease [Elusimicrobiales bacterium]